MSDLRDALERLARAADEMDGEFGGERLDELRDAREAALAVLASHPVSSPSPEARTEEPINQCDGCRRRLPLNEHGTHVNPDGSYDRIGCTANRYRAPSPVQGEAHSDTCVGRVHDSLGCSCGAAVQGAETGKEGGA